MVISHNMLAHNANRQWNIVSNTKRKTVEKLSSGYRINRAADDAAGLSISEKMRRQIRGLSQASKNCSDGVSFCQVADGALNEVHDMMQRVNELAVQAANGTNTEQDRQYIDEEVQQFKAEMKRVFKTTEFNELRIWDTPYVPSVSRNGYELDFQTYNDDNTGHVGGISVQGVRYSWKELGLEGAISADGQSFVKDGTYGATLPNGEKLELVYKENQPVSSISRVYRWEADASGITINKNSGQKISWATMGLDPSDVRAGTYSFDYYGTTISFDVPKGDDIGDVIKGINGDGISGVNWQTESMGMASQRAVNVKSVGSVSFTAANQAYLCDTGMKMLADSTGIQLVSDNQSYTKKSWSSFSDVATGKYPIVDWGTQSETNANVTLNDAATYRYSDASTGFQFDFSLTDEVSLETAIESFNNSKVQKSYSAAVNDATETSGNVDLTVDTSSLTFAMQNTLGRRFYQTESLGVATSMTGNTFSLTIAGNAQSAIYEVNISDAELLNMIQNGGSSTFTLSLQNGSALMAGASPAEITEGLKGVVSTMDVTVDFSKIHALYAADGARVDATYIANAKGEMSMNIFAAAQKGNVSLQYDTNNKNSYPNILDMKVNPPQKRLEIQAGTETDQQVNIEWEPLNLSVLGLESMNVLQQGMAGAAIVATKKAMTTISEQRSLFGAQQNRLEHTIRNLDNIVENTTSAESLIRDSDMAKLLTEYAAHNIVEQAGQAILAQANQTKQGVLSLIQ